jgi:dephospho-CoA kinase
VRIAITGGIAEGKTTVLRMFEALGGQTVSSDSIVAHLLRPGTDLWQQLIQEFGDTILTETGELNRERLAALAFGETQARRRLNRLLHPAVVEAIAERARDASTPLFVEVPLLIEVCYQGWFDRIVVVHATPALQRQRLLARGVPNDRVRQLLRAQLPTRAKLPFADWIVRTTGSLQQVEAQVRRIWQAIHLSQMQRVY